MSHPVLLNLKVLVLLATFAYSNGLIILNATGSAQYFTSPDYPNNYPSNTEIDWLMTTRNLDSSRGSWIINLALLDFNMEAHSSCVYDYLQIFDGPNNTSPEVDKLCGSVESLAFSSSGPDFFFHLVSDYSITDTGFKIKYWATYSAFAIVTEVPPPVIVEQRDTSYKIIGGVVGGVLGLTLIGLIIYCVCWRRYKKKERPSKVSRKQFSLNVKGKGSHKIKTKIVPSRYSETAKNGYLQCSSVFESAVSLKESTPHAKRMPRPVSSVPISYSYWGNVPPPYVYIDPAYPAGHCGTPY